MKEKVLIICSGCLHTKKQKRISSDPEKTKFILLDFCYKCNRDQCDPIKYFDETMTEIKS